MRIIRFSAQNSFSSNRFCRQNDRTFNRFGEENNDGSKGFGASIIKVATEPNISSVIWKNVGKGGSIICRPTWNEGHYKLAAFKKWDYQLLPAITTNCFSTWTHATVVKSITNHIEEEKICHCELSRASVLNGFLVAKKLKSLIKKCVFVVAVTKKQKHI